MHELCEFLDKELKKLEKKASMNGSLSPSEIEYGDKVAHFYKTLKVTEAMEDGDDYSYDDGMGMTRGGGYSRARGRGRNARRDSMGRYSRERGRYSRDGRGGYSMHGNEEMIEELHGLMEDASDEQTRQAFRNFIQKLEEM